MNPSTTASMERVAAAIVSRRRGFREAEKAIARDLDEEIGDLLHRNTTQSYDLSKLSSSSLSFCEPLTFSSFKTVGAFWLVFLLKVGLVERVE